MPPAKVRVSAPSRLHFGMFSFGHARERQFGGVGVMIDRPGVEVSVSESERLIVEGHLAERASRVIESWAMDRGQTAPRCRVDIGRAAPEHVGLGTGTQLGLAIAAALNAFHGNAMSTAEDLATQTRRGERSAIGTHGFVRGGLLVEAGKLPGERISPLIARVELPQEWRFVLIRPEQRSGLSGKAEKEAFDQLSPVSKRLTAQLCRQVLLEMLPSAQRADFVRFAESIYQFGRTAGMCFAELQGGSFASEHIEQLVDELRDDGVRGVGQSSWGPTIFALADSDGAAQQIVKWVQRHERFAGSDCEVARVRNRGADVIVEPIPNEAKQN